jgi:hypothetical protein
VAGRIEVVAATVVAFTPIAAPVVVPLFFNEGRVDAIEIIVPPGPSGLVGFKVRHSAQVIIPYSGNAFIVTDDEKIHWPLENFPTGRAWDCVIYNLDIFPHTITFRFLVTDAAPALALPPLVSIGA